VKSALSGGATRALTMELLEDFIKREFRTTNFRCGGKDSPHVIGPRYAIGEERFGLCVQCGMQVPISRWP